MPVVVGLESREHYWERLFPRYQLDVYINTQLPVSSKILLPVDVVEGYFLDREYVIGDPHTTRPIDYRRFTSAEQAATILTRVGITHLLAKDDLPLLKGVSVAVQQQLTERYLKVAYAKNGYTLYEVNYDGGA